jgi:hypothetical protein
MKKNVLLVLIVGLFTGLCANAQKMVLKSGSFEFIKDQKTILVQYDYSNLGVGKYDKEEDYVAKKVEDYNKDEAGKGEKWKTDWYNDRSKRYEPKYELLFNENMAGRGLKCDKAASDAKFTMTVHTTFIEPGFNVGVTRKPAYINTEMIFKETASGKEVAVVTVQNCPGRDAMGFDYDTGYRIEEAYAKLGKSMASFINKNVK